MGMTLQTIIKCCNNNECENADSDDNKPQQIVNPLPILNDNKREELINMEDSFKTTIPSASRN